MRNAVSPVALDQIFRTARTYNGWTDTVVDEDAVRELYDRTGDEITLDEVERITI